MTIIDPLKFLSDTDIQNGEQLIAAPGYDKIIKAMFMFARSYGSNLVEEYSGMQPTEEELKSFEGKHYAQVIRTNEL